MSWCDVVFSINVLGVPPAQDPRGDGAEDRDAEADVDGERDESIKKLLEMLQSKGLNTKKLEGDQEEMDRLRSRVVEADARVIKLQRLLDRGVSIRICNPLCRECLGFPVGSKFFLEVVCWVYEPMKPGSSSFRSFLTRGKERVLTHILNPVWRECLIPGRVTGSPHFLEVVC